MTGIGRGLRLAGGVLAVCLVLPSLTMAHSPHHTITDIATAQTGNAQSHTYILITDQLFRSTGEAGPWKNLVNGINNQYGFTAVATSPDYANDGTAFVATSGDGVYRTTNQGDAWSKIVTGLDRHDIHLLSVSPRYSADGRVLAAAESGGVWRSVDRGAQWRMVLSENTVITAVAELDGSDGSTIFAGDAVGNVWRSDDGGRLWEIVQNFSAAGAITDIAVAADSLYIGTATDGLHRSRDQGASFEQVMVPGQLGKPRCRRGDIVTDRQVTSIATTTNGKNMILVTSWYGGVFVSFNDGDSWEVRDDGLSCEVQADQIGTPHFQKLAVLSHGDRQTIWLGAFDGLFRSEDDAEQWQQVETLPLGLIKGMAVTAGSDQPLVVALSTYGGGFYLTEDRGSHWTIGNKGLQTTRLSGLSFSPEYARNDTLYAGASRRLLKSSDRGQSWQRIDIDEPSFRQVVVHRLDNMGLPTGWLRSDEGNRGPKYPTHLVALAGAQHDTVLIATRYHGLMSYTDSTGDVESVWSGTDEVMGALAIAKGPGAGTTMFSSVRGLGVIRSVDGGASWDVVNAGLDFINDWVANPERGDFRRDIDIAISPAFASDRTVFVGSPAADGLFVSRNGGKSWQSSNVDFGVTPAPVTAVAVSPEFASDGTLLVSVKGAGLFRSEDRGASFKSIAGSLVEANASIDYLEFSPRFVTDQSIVAASDEQLFVSQDSGGTWSEVVRPVRYEDMRDVVVFDGDWQRQSNEKFSARTQTTSANRGSTVTLQFIGSGVRWLGSTGPDCGSAEVSIDGVSLGTISCEGRKAGFLRDVFTKEGLSPGPHTLQIRVVSGAVSVDAFDVLP